MSVCVTLIYLHLNKQTDFHNRVTRDHPKVSFSVFCDDTDTQAVRISEVGVTVIYLIKCNIR